ncbi:spore germination protein [Paenibacillus flagellatus]|uniref:Spore germination protein n=2 Tax=Paenibacillus flagellatus TaxID=2211139 RepID=A0A2V5K882_9BACL|nr:spore germination protein [Paenibacillus flagellatus]
MGTSPDIVIREWAEADGTQGPKSAVCYVDGLVDAERLTELLESVAGLAADATVTPETAFSTAKRHIPFGGVATLDKTEDVCSCMLDGCAVVLFDGSPVAAAVSIPGGARRAVEEPSSQTVIRGPKEGFTEDLSTNLALVRRKLRTPDLRVESLTIGRYTQTKVAVLHLQGVANDEVVKEVGLRLRAIDTDSILESGYIEELIQDAAVTPFPTLMNTERPDTVAGCLLEGQVAVFVDGTPFVLIAPITFFKFFQSSEDYYQRYDISSFLRVIRLTSFLVAMLLPSLYIAVTTFHQEMLPTTLLISLAAQREGTPLPAVLEALLMEITFEIIREAGVRMPRAIGPAISIVGALVLGQAAVQAGLVSAAMVIVVSFTAISNFVLPTINMAATVRLIRFALMFLAGTLGLFGIIAGLVPLLVHLVSLRSFGVPYFMPVAPFRKGNWKDLFTRVPWWAMKRRPAGIATGNLSRQADEQRPKPPPASGRKEN